MKMKKTNDNKKNLLYLINYNAYKIQKYTKIFNVFNAFIIPFAFF